MSFNPCPTTSRRIPRERCSEGHPNADLTRSLAHCVRHHAEYPDGREDQCQQAETAEEHRRHARRKERQCHVLGQGLYVVDGQVCVELLKLAAQCADHALRLACGAHDYREIATAIRAKTDVHERYRVFTQTEILAVSHYSDDFDPWAGGAFDAEALAESRLTWPESPGKRLVDHRFALTLLHVSVR